MNQASSDDSADEPFLAANRYVQWALDVLRWDGLLAFCVVGIPTAWHLLFPNLTQVHVLMNLFLPVFAFFIRVRHARTQFSRRVYCCWQGALFMLAILLLIFLETIFILLHSLDNAVQPKDWQVLGMMYLAYLTMIGLAFFPFKAETLH